MPFIDVWAPAMGVAVVHLEKAPQWLSLPVEVRPDRRAEIAVTEAPLAKFGQQEWLKPGESYRTVLTAVIFHHLDYYDPLKTYGQLLRRRGIAIPESSSDYAHEPYWKSWGWLREFTLDKIYGLLPELKSMGIHVANLDDGWYDFMGDWEVNRSPGKFPNGEPDMIAFVQRLHRDGFKSSFWWYPLGVSPQSRLAKERPDLLVQDETGAYPQDISSLHQLCPAHEPSLAHIRGVLTRAISVWGFDGAYTDFQGLSGVPPCFNPAHRHKSPLDSFQAMPKVFETIHKTLRELKKDSLHEVCICSLPHSPYNMPFYDLANASDPVSTWQVRSRVKAEKAIRGGTFAVGDCYQVPIQEWTGSSVPESFESAIGTGAQVTAFYTQLTGEQRPSWTRWFHDYRELGLSRAEYLNLYDLAFDKPEVHVLRKGRDMYYGIFADVWPRGGHKIELRGLDKNTTYEVYDYAHRRDLGPIKGADPFLNIAFKDNLLIRLRPAAN
jgi:alpha-galactosidase